MNSWQLFSCDYQPFHVFTSLPLHYFANHTNWPSITEYNQLLDLSRKKIISGAGQRIRFIPQINKSNLFAEQYEPRIFLKGEVLSRENSWHDFFNMLIWLCFPSTKSILNNLQYHALKTRMKLQSQRSQLENALTVFDENGVIIVSKDDNLLKLISEFRWKELFWVKRQNVIESLRCFVFGHSLHEKFLTPYIGMTGHAILLKQEPDFFTKSLIQQLDQLDGKISDLFNKSIITSTKYFHPFPILGMPLWHPENERESFYHNIAYFRSSNNKRK